MNLLKLVGLFGRPVPGIADRRLSQSIPLIRLLSKRVDPNEGIFALLSAETLAGLEDVAALTAEVQAYYAVPEQKCDVK